MIHEQVTGPAIGINNTIGSFYADHITRNKALLFDRTVLHSTSAQHYCTHRERKKNPSKKKERKKRLRSRLQIEKQQRN
jgi:hypothetical protein